MWADAQRDGRPAEYRWRPLRKFRNSIPCTSSLRPLRLGEEKKKKLEEERRKKPQGDNIVACHIT